MKLRTRIGVVAAGAVALAVVVVSLATYGAARRELRAEIDASLRDRVAIAQGATADLRPFLGARIVGFPGRRGPQFDTAYYLLTLPGGGSLSPPGQALALPSPDRDVGSEPQLRDFWVDDVHLRLISASVEPIGILTVARSLEEVDRALARLAFGLLAIGGVGSALAGIAGLFIGRAALKPIEDLTGAAERVAETQHLAERIAVEGHDEVARLAAAFNSMLAALEESRTQQRRLVRDAGHELRTPLTALRMNIEMLARSDDITEEERRQIMDAAVDEVAALSSLVTEVVDLATDRRSEGPMESLDLNLVVAEAAARCRRRSGREILVTGEGGMVTAGRSAIGRAVDNLLDNAVKWSPVDTPIEVALTPGRVAVRDQGTGIADADRPRVFDRFYRAETARAMPGSGLGLSIVEQIATDHGGSVFIEDAAGGGAIVGFAIPTS